MRIAARVGTQVRKWFGALPQDALPSLRSFNSQQSSSSASFTCSAPPGMADGDLLIAQLVYTDGGAGDSITVPSGWSTLDSSGTIGSDTRRMITYYKVASSEGGSWTWTDNTAARRYYLVICAFQNVDTNVGTSGIDNATFGNNTAGGASYASPATITPLRDGSLIFFLFETTGSDPSVAGTPASGYTEIYDTNIGSGTNRILYGMTKRFDIRTSATENPTATTNENQAVSTGARIGIMALRPKTTIYR